jgi:hypothetical protein
MLKYWPNTPKHTNVEILSHLHSFFGESVRDTLMTVLTRSVEVFTRSSKISYSNLI